MICCWSNLTTAAILKRVETTVFRATFQGHEQWICDYYLTHCVFSMVPQDQWGVKPREDSLALGCTAALLLLWPPRAPAPSPTALQLRQLLHTALIPPLTTASTARPTHRYCSTSQGYKWSNVMMWVCLFPVYLGLKCERMGWWLRRWWMDGYIMSGWISAAVTEWAVTRRGKEVEEMRTGVDIWTDRMREDLAERTVRLHLSLLSSSLITLRTSHEASLLAVCLCLSSLSFCHSLPLHLCLLLSSCLLQQQVTYLIFVVPCKPNFKC